MPPIPGMMHWHSLIARHAKGLKSVFSKGLRALDAQLSGNPRTTLQPVLARNAPKQPIHPLARIRQSQSRWYSTAGKTFNASIRKFTSSARSGQKFDRASFPKSRVGSYVQQSSGRAPFASTLRPNLTGGTLNRTAGGYTLGSGKAGGARYFSHGPASQAQVVQNVSQAVRAFFISGQKAQYDGLASQSGEKRFKAVSVLQDATGRKMRSLPKATPGSWIEFQINPSITALTPLGAFVDSDSFSTEAHHLNTDGLLDVLSVDFSRALKDLAAVLNDLQRLSALGDLPITHEASHLRVYFPGCDAHSVERLCEELNVQRGVVFQDEAFDAFAGTEIALLFPFAPSDASEMSDGAELFEKAPSNNLRKPQAISLTDMHTPEAYSTASTHSDAGFEDIQADEAYWASSPSAYMSVPTRTNSFDSGKHDPLEYQGFEGIYRFIGELDSARR